MSLVPYALRPRYVFRSFLLRRGVNHPNPLIQPIAMLLVGQGDYLRSEGASARLDPRQPVLASGRRRPRGARDQQAGAAEAARTSRTRATSSRARRQDRCHRASTRPESPCTASGTEAPRERGPCEHQRLQATIVKVLLRNPRREVELGGPRSVDRLLEELGLSREAHLVIRNGTLVPGDARLTDDDVIEVRPVISGGAG